MTRTSRCILAGLALIAAFASTAHASPADGRAPSDGYREDLALASGASFVVLLAGVAAEGQGGRDTPLSETLMTTGAIGSIVSGPIVHLTHRRYGRAAASLALRVGLPIAGGFVGGHLADCGSDALFCGLSEIGIGMMAGGVVASALDVALLAGPTDDDGVGIREDAEAPRPPTPSGVASLSPRFLATAQQTFLGVGGRF